MSECVVDTCHRADLVAFGLCSRHYAYAHRHGHPEIAPWSDDPLPLTDAEAAWLAAVVDCEGAISLLRSRRSHGHVYCPRISVGNTNYLLMQRLLEMTGFGSVQRSARPAPAKDCFHWNVSKSDDVRRLLLAIRGHLLLKVEQADLILALPRKGAKEPGRRAEIRDRLAELNRKGKS